MNEQKKNYLSQNYCFLLSNFSSFPHSASFLFFSPLLLLCKLRTTYSFMNSK